MPYRNMSLKDFAAYVGMDAREVQKMADRGKLPGQKIGGQWRFNQSMVTEWLQQEMHMFDENRLAALDQALGSAAPQEEMITDMMGLEGIDISFPAKTKASVLRELIKLAENTGMLYDKDGLLEALEQREAMCSTALPNGIAIPHPRQPMPYVTAEPLICVARLPKGIAFGSPYRELTRMFFLICCHDDRQHLRTLARLVRLLDGDTVNLLMCVEHKEEILQVLIDKEKHVATQAD